MILYDYYIAIDWSGNRQRWQPAIAVAVAPAKSGEVYLIDPPQPHWTRTAVLDWIRARGWGPGRALIGFDAAFGLPYLDHAAYLPGEDGPGEVRALWRLIDRVCQADPNLGENSFLDRYQAYFRLPQGLIGARYEKRLRVTEIECRRQKLGQAESPFHMIGPTQVGKSALTCMRLLAQLVDDNTIAVWPFDEPQQSSVTLVEIFCSLFARQLGYRQKIRDRATLSGLLGQVGAHMVAYPDPINDHQSDAILSAAGMRLAADDDQVWFPDALSPSVRRTEGWIFGLK